MNIFHKHENRSCIFEHCNVKFDNGAGSYNHIRLKHILKGHVALKPEHMLNQSEEYQAYSNEVCCDATADADNSPNLSVEDNDHYSEKEFSDPEADEKFFRMQFADFLNRMCNCYFIPAVKVTEIVDNFLQNSIKSREVRRSKLLKTLNSIVGLSQSDIERIVKNAIDDDYYLNAQIELSTEYKRNRYIEDNFKYVAPVQITLNKAEVCSGIKADMIHYIPIKDSFTALVEDKSFNDVIRMQRELDTDRMSVV